MYLSTFYAHIEQNIQQQQGIIFSIKVEKIEDVSDYIIICRALLQKAGIKDIHILDIKQHELDFVYKELAISFLGTKKYYFILGYDTLSKNQKNDFCTYLSNLNSPHVLCIFSSDIVINNSISIKIPYEFTQEEVSKIIEFFLQKKQLISHFFNHIETKKGKISLTKVLLLFNYLKVVRSNTDEFFVEWLPRIFKGEHSLFSLAESFFANDTKKFLILWKKYNTEYSFVFWTTFFSEQLFKATLYVIAQKQKNTASKEIESRLPFSFIKKDWKLHSIEKLTKAHHEICLLDIKYKQGEIREDALELFCIKFMSNFT